jgi:hypothetical protein
MKISRQPLPVKIMTDQKQLENVESFKYLGSILTNDGRCPSFPMALQPGVGLGLLYNVSPSLSIPWLCPFH